MTHSDPVRRHLDGLPEAELPEHLWARLERARARRIGQQRWGLGTAALLLGVLALMPLRPSSDAPTAEAQIAQQPPANQSPVDSDLDTQLRALDRDLQAAYNRNSSDAEIAELWAARHALLASRPGQVARPTRI